MQTHLDIKHAGATFRIQLKRVPTARRYTLRVRAATRDVLLTIPGRGVLREAQEFAVRHAAWIGARLNRLPQPIPFAPGNLVPLRGVDHLIVHAPSARGTVWIETSESESAQPLLCVAGQEAHVARRVMDFLLAHARSDLQDAVRRHSAAIEKRPTRVTIRDTSSRWGSCSANGSLNFSWRLILAPAFVLNYLAAHEVCHLVHLNHSAHFWRLAKSLCPDTDRAEAWLSANGAGLHRYGKMTEA